MARRLPNMIERIGQLRPELLLFIMVALIALISAEAWVLLFKEPLAEFQRAASMRAELEREVTGNSGLSEAVGHLQGEVAELTKQLEGGGPMLSTAQMIAHIIGKLDQVSARHDVQLAGVKPGLQKQVLMFEEIPFEIEARGRYLKLFDWLREAQRDLGPLVVTQFEFKFSADQVLDAKIRFSSYRLAEKK